MSIDVYTAGQVAERLGCQPKTVEEMARVGKLPGIKPGGSWVFPAGALSRRLDELALEEAAARRQPPKPTAVATAPVGGRTRRQARVLPKLVDLGA